MPIIRGLSQGHLKGMPCAIAEIRDFYGREDVGSIDDSAVLNMQ
ncbi:MAG: hypothetical protein AAGG55_09680 [Pseudomonadota bacterium]